MYAELWSRPIEINIIRPIPARYLQPISNLQLQPALGKFCPIFQVRISEVFKILNNSMIVSELIGIYMNQKYDSALGGQYGGASERVDYLSLFHSYLHFSNLDKKRLRKQNKNFMGRDCTITAILHLDAEKGHTRMKEFKNR